MNTLRPSILFAAPLLPSASAWAQNGNMMGGGWSHGFMGGYGGAWLAVVLLGLIIGFAVWVIKRK